MLEIKVRNMLQASGSRRPYSPGWPNVDQGIFVLYKGSTWRMYATTMGYVRVVFLVIEITPQLLPNVFNIWASRQAAALGVRVRAANG